MRELRQRSQPQPEPDPAGSYLDSRQYIFSFPIHSLSDIPPDFTGLPDLGELRGGVLLPRADAHWPGRRAYPARVLLLTDHEVVVAGHPSEREPILRMPIRRIQSIECGRILLLGWFVLIWDGGQKCLAYNTTARGPVEACIRTFEEKWLPAERVHESWTHEPFGNPLTLKFDYARSSELLSGEAAVAQFFQPPVCHVRQWLVLRRQDWSAADLLMVTSRRLLWIRDRYQGRYECYGVVSRSAPLSSVIEAGCVDEAPDGAEFKIVFRSGDTWQIPLPESEGCETRRFEGVFWRTLNELTRGTR